MIARAADRFVAWADRPFTTGDAIFCVFFWALGITAGIQIG